jgi:hypothetical protein
MAEPPAPPPADPPAAPPPADPPAEPPAPTADEVVKNPQALIDALGATRDENRRQARRLKDFERTERERTDASRTELERATDRATAAESTLGAAQLDRLRLEVALEQLVGDDPKVKWAIAMSSRLQGKSKDELVADAAQMRQLLGQSQPPPPPGARPDYGSGSRIGDGAGAPANSDAAFNATLRRAAGR